MLGYYEGSTVDISGVIRVYRGGGRGGGDLHLIKPKPNLYKIPETWFPP